MRDYLVFTIAAPLASFGMKYDPGGRRYSANRPSKSGVLGLVSAALGIERQEQERFNAFATASALRCASMILAGRLTTTIPAKCRPRGVTADLPRDQTNLLCGGAYGGRENGTTTRSGYEKEKPAKICSMRKRGDQSRVGMLVYNYVDYDLKRLSSSSKSNSSVDVLEHTLACNLCGHWSLKGCLRETPGVDSG